MKDFHRCFSIVLVYEPDWFYDYLSDSEYIGDLSQSEMLWFALFCFEARSQE